ncbi:MAG: hypothetical protein ACE5G0_16815 [Rhodothermales bacterium]
MGWIKNVLVDVAVTLLIVLATTLDLVWAQWIVLIYTPFMVILKIVAFLGSKTLGHLKQKASGVPTWFYHVLYAVNVLVSAVDQWWLVAGGWALIWLLSIAADMRSRPAAA